MHFQVVFSLHLLLLFLPALSYITITAQTSSLEIKSVNARKMLSAQIPGIHIPRAQDPDTQAPNKIEGPDVRGFSPQTVSINSVLQLQGYRLSPTSPEKVKAYFLQYGSQHVARTGGGSSTTNDEHNGAQTLDVIVPEEVTLGESQVYIEVNGFRSAPITVTIIDWQLPQLNQVSPTSGSPGTFVHISCVGFHIYDEIALTDAAGKVTRFPSGGSYYGTGFTVPKDAVEGPMTIRIGKRKFGKFTQPVTFLVTNDALPIELAPAYMTPVAPGQWLNLAALSFEPLKHSELTEVAFKQGGGTIIIATPTPRRAQVAVPAALSPGDVQLQVRTWRNGRPSVWSAEASIRLPEQPVPPLVEGIRLEKGTWVHLWPGPDRAQSFTVTPGDVVVINGSLRAGDTSKLKVSMVGNGTSIDMAVDELDGQDIGFHDVFIKLPKTLMQGEWRMLIANLGDGLQVELPIVIRVITD